MASKRSKRGQNGSDNDTDLESLRDSFEEEEKSFSESESSYSSDEKRKKKSSKKKSSSNSKSSSKSKKSKKTISSDDDDDDDDEDDNMASEEVSKSESDNENMNSEDEDDWDSKNSKENKNDSRSKKKSPKNKIKINIKGRKRHISDVEDGEVSDTAASSATSSDADSNVSSVFNDGYDSEMLGDEEDRKRLDELTEKEREQEIYRRTEQRDVLMGQFEMKKKIKRKEKDARRAQRKQEKLEKKRENKANKKNKSFKTGSGSSDNDETRSKTKLSRSYNEDKDGTSDDEDASLNKSEIIMDRRKANETKRKDTHVSKALANLKADREKKKQQAEESRHRMAKIEQQKANTRKDRIVSSSEDEEPKKRSKRHSDTSSSDSENEEDSNSSADEDTKFKQSISTKDELAKVKLSRFRIEKWVHAPFFKKIACGCFVRIGIGLNGGASIYRVAEVLDVVETAKVYTLGTTKTNKGFKLRHGEDERTYRLEFVSNQMFSDSEYNRWKESMNKGHITLPTVGQIDCKSKELKAYSNYRFNDEDIDYIINEKKRFSQKSDKIAEKKIELLKEKEEAEQMGEIDRAKEIDGLIQDLNEKSTTQNVKRNGSFNLLAAINQRNREESNKRVENAMKYQKDRKKEAADDIFLRRKGYLNVAEALRKKSVPTFERKETDKNKKDDSKIKKNDSVVFDDLLAPVIKTEAPKAIEELPTSFDVLHTLKKDLSKPKENSQNDLFMAHNFDININLAVPAFTPSAGSSTSNVQENRFASAPGHLSRRALNLDEYKKKKGLI